jgi:hypothetical protein
VPLRKVQDLGIAVNPTLEAEELVQVAARYNVEADKEEADPRDEAEVSKVGSGPVELKESATEETGG